MWKSIDSSADGREGDGMQAGLECHGKAVAIAISQQLVFIAISTLPHRTNGVDHMLRQQIKARSDFCLAHLATAKVSAEFIKALSSGAVNRSIDAATAEQRGIGCIYDGVDVEIGNISHYDSEPFIFGIHFFLPVGIGRQLSRGHPSHRACVPQWRLPTSTSNAWNSLKSWIRVALFA